MSAVLETLKHVPTWLMPGLVVAIIGLMLWNQNNERRFVVIEERMARNEERINNNVALIERVEKGLITDFATARAEDLAHVTQTRALVIKDFEDRITRINARLDALDRHLEAADEKIDDLRQTMPRH